jgi:hypothetical protein
VCRKVQYGKESIRVRFNAIRLHGASERRLRQYQVRELGEIEQLGVDVEELSQQCFEAVEVDVRVGVKPFEFDVDHVHVLPS